ncbi:MAG: hypothetical protein IKZ64_00555 [Alphaproteobacteria bacterium]|nr:hypothetical protein [Alphaproteobacteria bacterium]
MKKNICSLLCIIIAAGDAMAGIRVGNLSRNYAGSSKNVVAAEQRYYNSTVSQDVPVEVQLPVPVANAELAEQVKTGDTKASTDMDTLNKCAMIYPDGEFVWDVPTMGRGAGGKATCVAVIEMRKIKAAGSQEYIAVARARVAAGDVVHCNISEFPQTSYLPEISDVEFPADNEPTREEVIQVMNEEQKGKAGLKIAAAALIGGLGGNLVGKSKPGEDSLLGTNDEKLKTTAIGAAAGAAIMAASTYSGKVAGDVILHTTVNAAAGGVVGNMSQTGDSVLRIEPCTYQGAQTTCLWGTVTDTATITETHIFASMDGKNVFTCALEQDGIERCRKRYDLIVRTVARQPVGTYTSTSPIPSTEPRYYFRENYADIGSMGEDTLYYYEATAEKRSGVAVPAVIPGFKDTTFGTKVDTWATWKANNPGAMICRRDSKGDPIECGTLTRAPKEGQTTGDPFTLNDFNPKTLDADDGSVIDFSNKARLGSTLKGAGVGAAMGGFSGYQGAQADIEERFVQARAEYRASLQKFYCGTGKKFISFYNDEEEIPSMGK